MARVDGIQDGYDRGKADRTAWLIEIHAGSLTEGEASGPQYFQLAHDDDWTKDQDKALQLARKEDAEAVIAHFGWTYANATEHMWPDTPGSSELLLKSQLRNCHREIAKLREALLMAGVSHS